MSEIARLQSGDSVSALLGVLDRDGVAIVERAADHETLGRVQADLDPWFHAAFHGNGLFFGKNTRRFGGLFAKAPSAASLALHPLVLEATETLLLGPGETPHCDVVELNLAQAIGIEPGEKPQFLHRDDDLWPWRPPFDVMVNVMWSLDEFTNQNGATRFIPGSHRWPRDRLAQMGETVAAPVPAGSAILWVGGMFHGGGANATDRIRRGAIISYRLGWLAPAERLMISNPPEAVRTLPRKLQRLLGYQIHRPNMGWVEGQDPLKWLQGEIGALAPPDDNLPPVLEKWVEEAAKDDPDEILLPYIH